VLTLPAAIADIAYQNKAVIYDLLFSAETVTTIAAEPKHLGVPRLRFRLYLVKPCMDLRFRRDLPFLRRNAPTA
jgi:hypothetical protein